MFAWIWVPREKLIDTEVSAISSQVANIPPPTFQSVPQSSPARSVPDIGSPSV
jgi:hypothetical protein